MQILYVVGDASSDFLDGKEVRGRILLEETVHTGNTCFEGLRKGDRMRSMKTITCRESIRATRSQYMIPTSETTCGE
tara:strand:- start:263 stop:493 length:231 start_codon:yes stop_codon:yes gene_type:complete